MIRLTASEGAVLRVVTYLFRTEAPVDEKQNKSRSRIMLCDIRQS